jgi:KAP-like P-loop domain-containing protein
MASKDLPPHELLHDAAISLPDEDLLGRKNFAKFLAKAIMTMPTEEGFVIGLQGGWGTGKSSILNLVRHYVEHTAELSLPGKPSAPVIVRFNPWWFTGSDQLIQQFFKQISKNLGQTNLPSRLKKLGGRLETFGAALKPLQFVPLPTAVVAGTVGKVLSGRARRTSGTNASGM